MTDSWIHTRQFRDLETFVTLSQFINLRLGYVQVRLGCGFVFAHLLFQVITFQSVALPNHLDYMCIVLAR